MNHEHATSARQPLDGRSLTPERVHRIAVSGDRAYLTRRAQERNREAGALARDLLDRGVPVYGRNTGVGSLLNQQIYASDASHHSLRLLRSHAGGAGPLADPASARALLVVRANQLGAGGAGVDPRLHRALVEALNAQLAPAVHQLGSIGTGDLTALAEVGLALVGEGRWLGDGRAPVPQPIAHGDAIALISSNAGTLGEAALACHQLHGVLADAEVIAALSFIAAQGNPDVFDARVHMARSHPGQVAVAAVIREIIGDALEPERLQDPLCFRCIPQVQGAAHDVVAELDRVLRTELNAAAENPLLDVGGGRALANGNFHMSRLALALDQVRSGLVQAGSLAVQRVSTLFDGRITGLPPFLAGHTDGSSGGMILEYTANAALEELRAAATPVTLSTTVMSQGQENHASGAPLAARQLGRALEHYTTIVGVELITAVRALRLSDRRPTSERGLAAFHRVHRALPSRMEDRELSEDLEVAATLLRGGDLSTGAPQQPGSAPRSSPAGAGPVVVGSA